MPTIREIANFLWEIADEILRDDFKRSKYPDVILPFVVLRRLDCVLKPTKETVLKRQAKLVKMGLDPEQMEGQLRKASGYAFYNTSKYDFESLLDDSQNIRTNLVAYINGFSENVRDIVEKFALRHNLELLDQKNLLFMMVQKMASPKVALGPDAVSNHDMGYVFEELLRRFNEQANENPGEHFTPREVVRLMVRLALGEDHGPIAKSGAMRTIYDPACGTGGMLSVTKSYILDSINPKADIMLFGQEVNPETYAICKSDLLIKGDDRDASNIRMGSTLSEDGHAGQKFDYMISNPPYGKDWNKDAAAVLREKKEYNGRFTVGLPRKSDGQMLFLLHMLSKMKSAASGGSRIAIIMNGSPLFSGSAGGGESEIRRHVLENDWLEAIVALPSQLFYNTGINTYIWILTNRKPADRKGKVLLVNGAATVKDANGKAQEVFAQKMRKSLGDKRNELTDEHLGQLMALATGQEESEHVRVFDTEDFGYRRITVERPLRLNFQAGEERVERIKDEKAFATLATSKKRDPEVKAREEEEGREQQATILDMLATMPADLHRNRKEFEKALKKATKDAGLKLAAPVKKAILSALSERDEEADICTDAKGNPEPDTSLRDNENVPLKEDVQAYFEREVLPHVPDAWINDDRKCRDDKDKEVGIVGYEINLNRYFYRYEPPRPLGEIDADIKALEAEILDMLGEVTR
jgi:type I restriction enzyme M protein